MPVSDSGSVLWLNALTIDSFMVVFVQSERNYFVSQYNVGEGVVVNPFGFIVRSSKGELLQSAVKCRGKEYLRIIYGSEFDFIDLMLQLKQRGLSRKRSLALREFALGIEGLERFVNKEPLRRVHESVFGVLALESESVDPRL